MTGTRETSAEITKRARSNLAYALVSLPPERRQDMTSFYAFCRVVDDIADDQESPIKARRVALNEWRTAIQTGQDNGDPLAAEIIALIGKYSIDPTFFYEIIDGMASDLDRNRFATYEELLHYCYQVASAVGLISKEIFGATQAKTRDYAIHLGYALQLTNIIRDVGQDAHEANRIYLPQEDLRAFGVSEEQILAGFYDDNFIALMDQQYFRALNWYQLAADELPKADRKPMIAAEMMAQIYYEILQKMKRQEFPVLHQRTRLHPARKLLILFKYTAQSLLT